MSQIRRVSRRQNASFLATLLVVSIGCRDTTAPPDPGNASYSVSYTPARPVGSVPCPRYLSYAILSMGSRTHTFSLSINLMDDCTAAGTGWTYWETFIEGTYSITDTMLTLTPNGPPLPAFRGSYDAQYVRITVPAQVDSLAPVPVPMVLGPRSPF